MSRAELRHGSLRDLAALLPLWSRAHAWHVEHHADYFAPLDDDQAVRVLRRDLVGIIDDPQQLLLVAPDPECGSLVGIAHALLHPTPPLPELKTALRCELVQLAVRDDRRRVGHGTRLLDGVRAWGKRSGASELVLTVWDGNRIAERFYRAHGLAPLHRVLATAL